MRDPRGTLAFTGDVVTRTLHAPLPPGDFLRTPAARALVADGRLIEFTITGDRTIESPRVPFVTYPHEWTDGQLLDAATLTLDVAERAIDAGFVLKDASAWNVVFDGTTPRFCDHLSFEPLLAPRWWAFGQFVRHFILPLCLARHRGIEARRSLQTHFDGVPPGDAARVMGLRRYLTRFWPLMVDARASEDGPPVRPAPSAGPESSVAFHRNLLRACRWYLRGTRSLARPRSAWGDYVASRVHYDAQAVEQKRDRVTRSLTELRPDWVLDLGCNTGEFSRLARRAGARVIAVDADQAAVQAAYLEAPGDPGLYPMIADLTDLVGARGWAGAEFAGQAERLVGCSDLVLALALLHHLAISGAVRLPAIGEFLHRVTRRHAIVELLDATDPLVVRLSAQRARDPSEFSLEAQRAALAPWFETLTDEAILDGRRRLVLLQRREREIARLP